MIDRPEDERANAAAAAWYARRADTLPGEAGDRAFACWHAAHPSHGDAWRRLAAVEVQLNAARGEPAIADLVERARQAGSRRKVKGKMWITPAATAFLAIAGILLGHCRTDAHRNVADVIGDVPAA